MDGVKLVIRAVACIGERFRREGVLASVSFILVVSAGRATLGNGWMDSMMDMEC